MQEQSRHVPARTAAGSRPPTWGSRARRSSSRCSPGTADASSTRTSSRLLARTSSASTSSTRPRCRRRRSPARCRRRRRAGRRRRLWRARGVLRQRWDEPRAEVGLALHQQDERVARVDTVVDRGQDALHVVVALEVPVLVGPLAVRRVVLLPALVRQLRLVLLHGDPVPVEHLRPRAAPLAPEMERREAERRRDREPARRWRRTTMARRRCAGAPLLLVSSLCSRRCCCGGSCGASIARRADATNQACIDRRGHILNVLFWRCGAIASDRI